MPSTPRPPRDHRIDLLRGLALTSIFINHVPGNVLEPFTHKNFGLSDSAELFVLLAGIAAAFAYFPRFLNGQPWFAIGRTVTRAGLLYVAHLASTVVGLAILCFAAIHFARPDLLGEINIGPVIEDPARALVGIATLGHQLGYHNILPLYVGLLLFLPIIMALAANGLRTLLAVSVGFFALVQIFGWSLPNYPTDGTWAFNPFAWQLIFVVGFVVGARIARGEAPVPYVRPLWWAGLAYLVGAAIFHRFNFYGILPDIPYVPHNFQINEKPWVAAPRLLHILSLAYVVGHSPIMTWLGKVAPTNPLTAMGRHSLPVFWLGTALSMVGLVLMAALKISPLWQTAYLAAGFAAQALLAIGLDRLGAADKARRAVAAKPATASEPPFHGAPAA